MSTLLEQASLVMIPSGYKEDVVYSQIPTSGAGDLSFTRASNGTRVNSAGLVEVCPWNLLEYSEDFSNAVWNKYQSAITANATTAPNGTTTADKLEYTTTGTAVLFATSSALQNQVYALSCYAKQGTTNILQIGFTLSGGDKIANFNLNTGVITTTSSGVTASIESVGDGWYRCIMSLTTDINTPNVFINSTSGTTGNYIYIWGAQSNIGSTAKPYFPTTDRLNVPRLTYQNGGGGCPSLLLEKQSTNIAIYSEQFNDASWGKSSITVTANDAISPDGTQNADKITSTNASNTIQLAVSSSSGVDYTISVFAKNIDAGNVRLDMSNVAFGPVFTFATKTFTTVSGWTTSYQEFSNGWFRLIATRQSNSTSASPQFGLDSVVGSVYFWGAQFEQSSYPTSYIPTTSASATRVADACSKTGISSLIGQTEGVIYWDIEVETLSASGNENILNVDSGSFGNTMYLIKTATGGVVAEIYVSNVAQCLFSYSLPSVGRYKMALAYKANDFALYVNGVSRGTDSSGSVPTCSRLQLGNGVLGPSDGKTNQAILFKTRLTNAELASLTTI